MARPPLPSARYFGDELTYTPGARERRPFPPPGTTRRYARARVADIRHIRLELSFDFAARKLMGRCSTTLVPINDGLERLEFDAVELTIQRVVRNQTALAYTHDGRKLGVTLDAPLAGGEEVTITVDYAAQPRRGLYFNRPDDAYPQKPLEIWTQGEDEDSRYWFPCYDYPNDKATSEIVATVPREFFALSNGKLVEVRESQGAKTFHWRQDVPHAAYLIMLAVGPYVEI